jgi:hypothetical protein
VEPVVTPNTSPQSRIEISYLEFGISMKNRNFPL